MLQSGDKLQHYEIKKRLGKGGFGEVWLAHDLNLEIEVAIKIPLPQYANDNQMMQRFLIGARAAARLQHPNIVRMLYMGEIPERQITFSVMEYLPNGTLTERLEKKSMSIAQRVDTFCKVAEGLHFAHQQNFVHRDIKPDNILYRRNDEPVVTDFDLSRVLGETRFTQKGFAVGTVYYIAPEQALGEEVSPASDIYSLGVMLFQILTDQLPFDSNQLTELISMHMREPVPHASAYNPQLPKAIDRVIEKAMAKKDVQRFATALDFAQAVREAFGGQAKPQRYILRILSSPDASLHSRVIPLDKDVLRVGFRREDGNDIGLNDKYVSTRHGRFERQDSGWVFIDQKSTNHTFFMNNGRRVGDFLSPHIPYNLKVGDVLEIGDTQIMFDQE